MLYVTKAPPARSQSLRPAAPRQRGAPKAAPPVAKPAMRARAQLRAEIAEALGGPKAPAKAASVPAKRASSTKPAVAPTKAASKRAAPAVKMPVPLPAPRQAPPKVQIGFPKLPGQVGAARDHGPQELQALLVQYRKFVRVTSMIAETRALTKDERHQVECARARISEIKGLGWSSVR